MCSHAEPASACASIYKFLVAPLLFTLEHVLFSLGSISRLDWLAVDGDYLSIFDDFNLPIFVNKLTVVAVNYFQHDVVLRHKRIYGVRLSRLRRLYRFGHGRINRGLRIRI